MTTEQFASVWDAIEGTPEQAANMRFRSDMMIAITSYIEASGLSQAKAARALGITQPRLSDLKRGKVALFSLDALVNMLAVAGLRVRLEVDEPKQAVAA